MGVEGADVLFARREVKHSSTFRPSLKSNLKLKLHPDSGSDRL